MESDSTPGNSSVETLKQLENRLNMELCEFFKTEPLTPTITTYTDKADLDRVWINHGDDKYIETPDWLVGFATHDRHVHILSPDVMPAGFERTGKIRFSKTLKHEIGHLYTSRINKQTPSWLSEGVSLYIAGQDQYNKIDLSKITLALLTELANSPTDARIYQIGKTMVDQIMNAGGKELLCRIIGTDSETERYRLLQEAFSWLI